MTNYEFKQDICKQLNEQIKKLAEKAKKLESLNERGTCFCNVEEIACDLIDINDEITNLISNEYDSRLSGLLRYLDEEDY